MIILGIGDFCSAECTSDEVIDIAKDPQGSLHGFNLPQNQISLGTCASNSLSLGLGAHADAPLSFLQIATHKYQSGSGDVKQNKKKGHWISGSSPCTLFNNIKKEQRKNRRRRGGGQICFSDDSQDINELLKRQGSSFLKKLEGFYLSLNSSKRDGKKNKKIIKKIVSKIRDTGAIRCSMSALNGESSFPRVYQLTKNFKNSCVANYYGIKRVKKELQQKKSALDVTGDEMEESVSNNFSLQIKQLSARKKYLEEIFSQTCDSSNIKINGNKIEIGMNPNLKESIERYGRKLQDNPSASLNPSKLREELSRFVQSNFSVVSDDILKDYPEDRSRYAAPVWPKNAFVGLGTMSDLTTANDEVVLKFFGGQKECMEHQKNTLRDNFSNELLDRNCEHSTEDKRLIKLFDDLLQMSEALSVTRKGRDEDIVELLMSNIDRMMAADSDQISYLRNIMSNSCEEGYLIPKKMECENTAISARPDEELFNSCKEELGDRSNSIILLSRCMKKKKPNFENYAIEQRKNSLRSIISKNLRSSIGNKNGVPTLLNICASFLGGGPDGYQYKEDYHHFGLTSPSYNCKSEVSQGKETRLKHADHGVVVIGMKCVEGETQYLIQNSWGKTCYPYTREGKQLFECDKERGTIWVGENKLINNVVETFTIKEGE